MLLTVLLPVILLTLGLALFVAYDVYIRREHQRIMLIICALMFVLIVQNHLDFLFETRYTNPLARTLCGIVGYTVRPVILVLFCHIVSPKRRFVIAWTLAGLNAAVYLTALFSPLAFWISENNHFHRGPLNLFAFAVSAVLLVLLLFLSLREFHSEKQLRNWLILLPVLIIVGSIYLDYQVGHAEQMITFLTCAIVLSGLFYYICLHLQFLREHERDLMAEQRIQIMMTQIQPHFLYNTIATFKALCRKDPNKAAEVAEKFGTYLRQNLDTLGLVGNIPFEKELEHTRLYSEIEMVRFENIRVEYDIADDGFSLPPLTVQPIVENAIRHGIRSREEGVVRVVVRRKENAHEIVVSDNGVGFDTSQPLRGDGPHIGLLNVRGRIEKMSGGTLEVESVIGEGTTVTIRIPAEEAAK